MKENLRKLIHISDDPEFCWSLSFKPELISSTCYLGFIPMATQQFGDYILLLKMHKQRCILEFENLHIPKTARKRARKFNITIDQAFEQCIEQIIKYHEDNWLYPPLAKTFISIFHSKQEKTKFHSFEIWENDTLVAGEIGYTVGSCYTSLTGFSNRNSAGTVQLCATAKILKTNGFSFWDLGMEMDYKLNLGATCISRKNFLSKLVHSRQNTPVLKCEKSNVHSILQM